MLCFYRPQKDRGQTQIRYIRPHPACYYLCLREWVQGLHHGRCARLRHRRSQGDHPLSHPDVIFRIILPCKNQADSWTEAQISLYEYTLANADEIEYVCDTYTDSCMKERNMRLAEECDMMIAYVSRPFSGAAQTVRMASKAGKVIYNLYPSLG